ncbi:hypothetical protein GCM10022225_21090 [Plantactinospora mayteni]|uniref:Uncharacterized protein n=1 Tax=Plantactinospora mayteni TaxID=566021 RepID=A0ABQ4ENU6_9ACTN|nr:hypothetical protein [Plantactinospora mayteni]GIG96290.1 hypothetical protein Pma05_28630 [Plantactinospora mayteni]
MAKDDEPVDDLHSVAWAPPDLSSHPPVSRLDYGDADQRAEMDGVDEMSPEEPVALVDTPKSIREPFSQTEKRRNQRRMPT